VILVDTSVLLDVMVNDPVWGSRSQLALDTSSVMDILAINDVIYAELSVRYPTIESFERVLAIIPVRRETIPSSALFLAAKAHQAYRRRGGTKTGVLSDFFIGAHAAVTGADLLTRDPARVQTYFPSVQILAP